MANLKKPGQLIGQPLILVQPTKQVLQPCRVATVTTMVRAATLGSTVTGGVRLRARLPTPGTATCTTITPMFTETSTTVSITVFLLGVLGISDLFDYLTICFINREAGEFLKINGTKR